MKQYKRRDLTIPLDLLWFIHTFYLPPLIALVDFFNDCLHVYRAGISLQLLMKSILCECFYDPLLRANRFPSGVTGLVLNR